MTTESPTNTTKTPERKRFFRRGPWETTATILIALGVVMLMQPFSMFLFSQSFRVILTGTIMFMIVSHFPED
ncbi:MAG: hypothetical protein ACRCYY_11715 [Trueperaceae bacterium]